HVTGSPTLTRVGTTFDAILKSPTAPAKPCGAGGRGRTSIVAGVPGTANCWYCLCWKKPKPVTPTLRLTSWLVGLNRTRPGFGARARVWYVRPVFAPLAFELKGSGWDQSSATRGEGSHSKTPRPQLGL